MSRDPVAGVVAAPETIHPYVALHSNPMIWRDPKGRFGILAIAAATTTSQVLSLFTFAFNPIEYFRSVKHRPDCVDRRLDGSCRVDDVYVYRRDIDLTGEDKYGHWWIELGTIESYGWWPRDPLSEDLDGLWGTITGVPGELNGVTSFGGTASRDPHHGDRGAGVEEFYVYAPWNITDSQVKDEIRQFAQAYASTHSEWSWPTGYNCHTFQDDLLDSIGLSIKRID